MSGVISRSVHVTCSQLIIHVESAGGARGSYKVLVFLTDLLATSPPCSPVPPVHFDIPDSIFTIPCGQLQNFCTTLPEYNTVLP